MSDVMQILRFAVGATTAVMLVGGAAMQVQGRLVHQIRAVPEEHVRAVFDRDFDFGEILPTGYCQGVSPCDALRPSASGQN